MTFLFAFLLFFPGLNTNEKLTIDFADYKSADFNSTECTYTANGIPFQFFDPYTFEGEADRIMCEEDFNSRRAFRGVVQVDDLPFRGKKVQLSVTSIECMGVVDFMEYEIVYENGETLLNYGQSVVIKKFHQLKSLSIQELECGLLGIEGHAAPIVIELEVLR